MSEQAQSRFTPQNPQWHLDLPARDAPDGERPSICGDLNHIDETYLEISRASGGMRGMMTVLSVPAFFGAIFVSWLFYIVIGIPKIIGDLGWLSAFTPIAPLGLIAAGIFALRLDLAPPRDEPIRFNRKRGKVYVSLFKFTWNPFVKWEATTKQFDWNTLQAEVTKFAGFNGKTYIERYTLTLLSVKPGTNEVLDRFLLVANAPPQFYPGLWAYIKTYMAGGPIIEPETAIRNQEVSFKNSMREWLPSYQIFQSPGYNGAIIKHSAPEATVALFMDLVMTLFIPALIFPALGHYIAMRFAPAAIWPPEIDAESKSEY